MSLIEEALRKQREETEKAKGGLTPQEPAVAPPPVPEEEAPAEESMPVRKAVPVLVVALLVGLLLVGGIVWVLFYGLNLRKGGSAKPVVAAVPAEKAAEAVVPAVTAAAPVVATAEPAPVVEEPPVVVTAPEVAVEAPVAATGSVATATTAPVAVTDREGVVRVEGMAEPSSPAVQKIEVVVWPKLTVTGLIGATRGGKSAALINGQMVTPGSTIEGVKIEAIDRQGVQLTFEGESRTLGVGSSTE